MPTVVVNHDLPIAEAVTGQRDDLVVLGTDNHDEALVVLRDAEMLVCNRRGWDDRYLTVLDRGNWIQVTAAGYDPYPLEELEKAGVSFMNAAGIHDPVLAEHTFALAFSFSRMLPYLRSKQQQHEWINRTDISLKLNDWKDRTLTIYGLGNIGETIATRGMAFDMEVHGIKRDPATYDGCLDTTNVHGPEGFQNILPHTDLLVVSVPLTNETRHSIDSSVFKALPNTAVVINIARGSVIKENDLIAALNDGTIAGAGIDVAETEPMPENSPLWSMSNVIITPHIGSRSRTFPDRFAALFLENYDRWLAEKPFVNQIV